MDERNQLSENRQEALEKQMIRQQQFEQENQQLQRKRQDDSITWILCIGVILILLSGIILATSTWDMIHSVGKIILLSMISIFFFLLHTITERVWGIRKTAFAFWCLGILFLPLIFFSIGYFDLFQWNVKLSFYGVLSGSICLLLFLYSIYKYKLRLFMWLSLVDSVIILFFMASLFSLKLFHISFLLAVYACILGIVYGVITVKEKERNQSIALILKYYIFLLIGILYFIFFMVFLNWQGLERGINIHKILFLIAILGIGSLSAYIGIKEKIIGIGVPITFLWFFATYIFCDCVYLRPEDIPGKVILYCFMIAAYLILYYYNKNEKTKYIGYGVEWSVPIVLVFYSIVQGLYTSSYEIAFCMLVIGCIFLVSWYDKVEGLEKELLVVGVLISFALSLICFTNEMFSMESNNNHFLWNLSLKLVFMFLFGIITYFLKRKEVPGKWGSMAVSYLFIAYCIYQYVLFDVFYQFLFLFRYKQMRFVIEKWNESKGLLQICFYIAATVLLFLWSSVIKNKKGKYAYLYLGIVMSTISLYQCLDVLSWSQGAIFHIKNTILWMSMVLCMLWFFLSEEKKKYLEYYIYITFIIGLVESSILFFVNPVHILQMLLLLVGIGCFTIFLWQHEIRQIEAYNRKIERQVVKPFRKMWQMLIPIVWIYLILVKVCWGISVFRDIKIQVIFSIGFVFLHIAIQKIIKAKDVTAQIIEDICYYFIGVILLIDSVRNPVAAIVFCIIAFISLLVGYRKQQKNYFFGGIIFLGVGIFIHMIGFWRRIPWWFYLLITGILLITIAFYSEYTKKVKKSKKDSNEM